MTVFDPAVGRREMRCDGCRAVLPARARLLSTLRDYGRAHGWAVDVSDASGIRRDYCPECDAARRTA